MTGGDNSCRNRGGPGIIPVQQAVTVIDKKIYFCSRKQQKQQSSGCNDSSKNSNGLIFAPAQSALMETANEQGNCASTAIGDGNCESILIPLRRKHQN